jgi:hypothetical protein
MTGVRFFIEQGICLRRGIPFNCGLYTGSYLMHTEVKLIHRVPGLRYAELYIYFPQTYLHDKESLSYLSVDYSFYNVTV